MVKIMENPIKMDDLGGKPPIFGNTHILYSNQPGAQLTTAQRVAIASGASVVTMSPAPHIRRRIFPR